MAVLVIADHNNSTLVPITLNTVTAAQAIDEIHLLVAGNNAGVRWKPQNILGVKVLRGRAEIRISACRGADVDCR